MVIIFCSTELLPLVLTLEYKEAVVNMDMFVMVISGSQDSISVQLNNATKDIVAMNGKKLQSIVETITLCGRQNTPAW